MNRFVRISLLGAALAAAGVYSVQPAKAQFSGCGGGVFGVGSVGLAEKTSGRWQHQEFATGWAPGVTGECGWKFGAIYLGAGADYSWQYGDLEKAGLKNDLTIFGKAGVVLTNTSMFYAHAGKAWLYGKDEDVGAWKVGVGSEMKLSNTPLYLDMRYSYVIIDDKDIPAKWEASGHQFRVGLNVKLGPGMFGGSGPVFSNEDYSAPKGCDPKIDRNCKVH